MNWSPFVANNALAPLPPKADIETKAILKATIEARAALASLEQAATSLPNPTVLINSIPILEAQASSEIENIVTTTDDLFRYAQDETAASNPATREALRYRTALFEGFKRAQSRPLNANTAIEICSIIKQREMPLRSRPGTFIGNPTTHEAIYTPPDDGALIKSLLSNWERFVHQSRGIDPLIVMAVAHYQFEAIHPFEDGNGRTGRVMNVLVLVAAGLISQPILYLSRYIIENKGTYYRLLQGVTATGDWQSWILYMLEGIRQTANFTLRKIAAIRGLQTEYQDRLRDVQGSVNADLLQTLFEQPYSRIANVMARCGVSRPTATGWLNALADADLLVKIKAGRELLYVNLPFMQVLTRDEPIDEPGSPTLF
jgi:Fic family protein